jgi:hypothetical protein
MTTPNSDLQVRPRVPVAEGGRGRCIAAAYGGVRLILSRRQWLGALLAGAIPALARHRRLAGKKQPTRLLTPGYEVPVPGTRPNASDPVDPVLDQMQREYIVARHPDKLTDFETAASEIDRHVKWFRLYNTDYERLMDDSFTNAIATRSFIAGRVAAAEVGSVSNEPVQMTFQYAQALQRRLPLTAAKVWPGPAFIGVLPANAFKLSALWVWARLPTMLTQNWNDISLRARCAGIQEAIAKFIDDAAASNAEWGANEDQLKEIMGGNYVGFDPNYRWHGKSYTAGLRVLFVSRVFAIPENSIRNFTPDVERRLLYTAFLLRLLLQCDWYCDPPDSK